MCELESMVRARIQFRVHRHRNKDRGKVPAWERTNFVITVPSLISLVLCCLLFPAILALPAGAEPSDNVTKLACAPQAAALR